MTTGLDVFDHTVQETNLWLKSIEERLQLEDRRVAYLALRGVLHALRDRIGPENAVHLGAQLPMLIRGLYYEGWRMGTQTKERHVEQFVDRIWSDLGKAPSVGAEAAARAVLEVMWDKLDPGEIAKVIELMPRELRDLWPQPASPR